MFTIYRNVRDLPQDVYINSEGNCFDLIIDKELKSLIHGKHSLGNPKDVEELQGRSRSLTICHKPTLISLAERGALAKIVKLSGLTINTEVLIALDQLSPTIVIADQCCFNLEIPAGNLLPSLCVRGCVVSRTSSFLRCPSLFCYLPGNNPPLASNEKLFDYHLQGVSSSESVNLAQYCHPSYFLSIDSLRTDLSKLVECLTVTDSSFSARNVEIEHSGNIDIFPKLKIGELIFNDDVLIEITDIANLSFMCEQLELIVLPNYVVTRKGLKIIKSIKSKVVNLTNCEFKSQQIFRDLASDDRFRMPDTF